MSHANHTISIRLRFPSVLLGIVSSVFSLLPVRGCEG
jgi:hypothetical protein